MINKEDIKSQIDFNKDVIKAVKDSKKYFESLIECSEKNFHKGIYTENFKFQIRILNGVIDISETNNRVLEDILISEGESIEAK